MLSKITRSLLLALACALAFAGCDGEMLPDDAGPEDDAGPRQDAGPRDDAGPFDGGEGRDAGPAGDAGPGDAGSGLRQSRVTAWLGSGFLTLDAVDESFAPLVIDAAHGFDHDRTPGETMFVSDGADRLELVDAMGTDIVFGNRTAWVDDIANPISPDLVFAGAVGRSPEMMLGLFGSDTRLYDFAIDRFSAAIPLTESGGRAFTPISATAADLGTGANIIALRAGSPLLHILNGTVFQPFNTAPVTCNGRNAIDADLVVGAEIPGASPPGGADSIILIEGSDAYALDSLDPVCFSDPYELQDQSGAPLRPELAFGIDYDGNGTDDLILIDTVDL